MYPTLVFEPRHEKTPSHLQTAGANNKSADQPCSLINVFVFRCSESMITEVAVCQNSWVLRLSRPVFV